MIEIVRIVEDQTKLYPYDATQDEERAQQLEFMIESTKQKNLYPEWHRLIATPFRYAPPLKSGRFCPTYGKNVFYASLIEETSLYEYAFHFMKQRVHLNIATETGLRTIFFVDADDTKALDIRDDKNVLQIIDKNDYAASQRFITENPQVTFILYPSCRDPLQRNNAAILNIMHIEKVPKWASSIKYFYDNNRKLIIWLDYQLHINWTEVH